MPVASFNISKISICRGVFKCTRTVRLETILATLFPHMMQIDDKLAPDCSIIAPNSLITVFPLVHPIRYHLCSQPPESGLSSMPHRRSARKRAERRQAWRDHLQQLRELREQTLNTAFLDPELDETVVAPWTIHFPGCIEGEVLEDSRGRGTFQRR
jgi:hypothetical protein